MFRRPAMTLVGALLLWFRSAQELLGGDINLDTAVTRLLVALAVAWAGVALVGRVIDGYAMHHPAPAPAQGRRRQDQSETAV